MDRTKYAAPTCVECGDEVTASRADYNTGSVPSIAETFEPCGCRVEFPLPTMDNSRAADALTDLDRSMTDRSPRDYLVTAVLALAVVVVYAALAVVRDDVWFLGASFVGVGLALQNLKARRVQLVRRSLVNRLVGE